MTLYGPVRPLDVMEALEKENIESRPVWKPMHMQPFFAQYDYIGGDVSEKLFENGVCLPSDTKMTDEDLERIVEAGLYAPTGMGRQGVKFVVVKNKEMRDHLSKLNADIMGSDKDPFYGAPVVIVVLAKKEYPTYIYDGSLAIGNMLNEAHGLGLGSCWIHRAKEVFASEEGKVLLKKWGVEGDYEGIGHCVLGYPAADIPKAKPRKENYVYYVD